ncbi:hypothetical protein CH63R_13378 [Colletotrichum higginsianum IMI 349063]|uniref:Uncharacterized protein n=1 Tax=Colletotrichum higginsianum (strain IMI 349063) TaxID=759273 RepID=A0A1B7XWX8_COLHI|nr:hypothetical protein CH63R_13378 [Colletotrichum higginsianum IMI 349063]OBR04251.1 hypothetical protein CH63R_13378 [Colletotrichum higginsianum IMI 349063]
MLRVVVLATKEEVVEEEDSTMVVTAEMVSKKRRACFTHRCARRDQVLGRPLHPPLYNVRLWRIKSFGVILGDYREQQCVGTERDWESTYNSRQNLLGSSPGAACQGQKRMEVVEYDTQKQTCDERVPGEGDPGTSALCIMYCLAVQGTRAPASRPTADDLGIGLRYQTG